MSFEQYKKPAGAGAVQNNYAGDGAPTVNNDTSEGYSVGSRWIDITNDESYICMDATDGSAVWVLSTAGTATEIVNTPAGNISATNVQSAINELDTEKFAVADVIDEDNMASNSATKVPTQQSVKAYVDLRQLILSEGAFVNGDKTKLNGIEAGADVTDATNVDSAGATMNSDTNVSGNSWVLDEDNMASNSNTKVPTQQSVKAYVDTAIAGVGGDEVASGTFSVSVGTSMTNLFSLTSLDGDTDGAWDLTVVGSSASSTQGKMKIMFNSSNTFTWERRKIDGTANGTGSAGIMYLAGSGGGSDSLNHFVIRLTIKATKTKGTIRYFTGTVAWGNGNYNMQHINGFWDDTTNNITSLQISALQDSGSSTYVGHYKLNRVA